MTDLQKAIEEAEKREVKAVSKIEKKHEINPALIRNTCKSLRIFYMKKIARREGNERMLKICNWLLDEEKIKGINTISKKLDGEDLIELIKQKTELNKTDSEELFREAFNLKKEDKNDE